MLRKVVLVHLAALLSAASPLASANPNSNFTYDEKDFLLDGKSFQIIGGQMDPQRIPREFWRQRLQMARAMGLNTIFSYIFWNDLEPNPGQWNFHDRNDIRGFFRIAQEEGLYAVLRPGPYICGEHEWGGFPAWLSQVDGMKVRENNDQFLNATKRYLDRLGSELWGLQITQGGPILMNQLENEYGSFGNDKAYLQRTADILRENFEVFLYTNDGGGNKTSLDGGTLHGVLAATDGRDPKTGFKNRDELNDPTMLGPQLYGEYWLQWFDNWAASVTHSNGSADERTIEGHINNLEWVLQGKNSFNIYMFHGGTNFGFESGSTGDNPTTAVTSSYDYGAPLDETGRPTEIYHKLRDMISKHVPAGSIPDIPGLPKIAEVAEFSMKPALSLFDSRSSQPQKQANSPVTMESLGQSYGFVLYEHKLDKDISGTLSPGDKPRDRVIVYINGKKVGVIDCTYKSPATVPLDVKKGDVLQLLVENLGRVDFSLAMKDQVKGIVGDVKIGNEILKGWATYSLPISQLPSLLNKTVSAEDTPVFYTGSFILPDGTETDQSGDILLTFPKGIKGQVWVNGINMGRYWTIGPQQSLYIPGCYVKDHAMSNDVVVLELEPKAGTELTGKGVATREWFNSPDPDAP